MSKRIFIVAGPESSGNRLVARLLVKAGCWGDGSTVQRLDAPVRDGNVETICGLVGVAENLVLVRSFPHAKKWINLKDVADLFRDGGFEPFLVITRRNWPCTVLSQMSAGHVKTGGEAFANIANAERRLAIEVKRVRCKHMVMDYDFLVSHPKAATAWLLRWCGFEPTDDSSAEVRVYNNDKHVSKILAGEV